MTFGLNMEKPDKESTLWRAEPSQVLNAGWFLLSVLGCFALLLLPIYPAGFLCLMGLASSLWHYVLVKFTRYELTNERLKFRSGLFTLIEHEIELYRVKDTRMEQTLIQRFFSVSDVRVISSDVGSPYIHLRWISKGSDFRELLRNSVESCRDKKSVREFDVF